MTETKGAQSAPRQRWMSVLAKAPTADLEAAWDELGAQPTYDLLRRPETGLVMVRGRAGGVGAQFNLGEMTVTRCSVRLADGRVGHAYVGGRDRRKSELAAVFDAMLQDDAMRPELESSLITPLSDAQEQRRADVRAKAAATRVDFFTMVRGS